MDFDDSHMSDYVGFPPVLKCYDFQGFERIRVFGIDGRIYRNFHGLAPACLPNLSVRNVWRASVLGSGAPLGGNTSRTQLGDKSLQNQWNINKFDATPCETNAVSTMLCGPSSVRLETLWWATYTPVLQNAQ